MNLSATDINTSRLETFTSNRQARFIGPLLGFYLASIFPNVAIAKLGHIRIEYDPVSLLPPNQPNHPSIDIYQTPLPTWEPVTRPIEEFQFQTIGSPEHHFENLGGYSESLSTNIESPSEYAIPLEPKNNKVSVKRAISQRYLATNRRNPYNIRKKFPNYFDYDNYDYFTTPRFRNNQRNQGRRPIGFDDEYDYDYDYAKPQKRKNQKKRYKNKNRKGPDYYSDEDFDDDVEPVTVVVRPRQQETTTSPTTTEMTTTPATTNITNGTTPGTTTTTNSTVTGYGYGPSTGNENVSITYGPPGENKPLYGVPGTISGTPLSEWSPTYPYDTPSSYYSHRRHSYYSPNSFHAPNSLYHSPGISYYSPSSIPYSHDTSYNSPSTSYGTPSISYGSPSTSYGAPSSSSSSSYSPSTSFGSPSATYGAPSSSYGAPSSSYGVPNPPQGAPASTYGAPSSTYGTPSLTYGAPSSTYGATSSTYGASRPPSTSYGVPNQSQGTPIAQGSSYQSYQLPYSSWYGTRASHSDMVRRAQDVIRYD